MDRLLSFILMAQNPQKRQVLLQWRCKQSKKTHMTISGNANSKNEKPLTCVVFAAAASAYSHYLTQSGDYSMAPKGYLQFVYSDWFWIAVVIFRQVFLL
jgi:hypothetical protein